jgi:hypothetical protein
MNISQRKTYKWARDILKLLSITSHQGNANQNHHEILSYPSLECQLSKKTRKEQIL